MDGSGNNKPLLPTSGQQAGHADPLPDIMSPPPPPPPTRKRRPAPTTYTTAPIQIQTDHLHPDAYNPSRTRTNTVSTLTNLSALGSLPMANNQLTTTTTTTTTIPDTLLPKSRRSSRPPPPQILPSRSPSMPCSNAAHTQALPHPATYNFAVSQLDNLFKDIDEKMEKNITASGDDLDRASKLFELFMNSHPIYSPAVRKMVEFNQNAARLKRQNLGTNQIGTTTNFDNNYYANNTHAPAAYNQNQAFLNGGSAWKIQKATEATLGAPKNTTTIKKNTTTINNNNNSNKRQRPMWTAALALQQLRQQTADAPATGAVHHNSLNLLPQNNNTILNNNSIFNTQGIDTGGTSILPVPPVQTTAVGPPHISLPSHLAGINETKPSISISMEPFMDIVYNALQEEQCQSRHDPMVAPVRTKSQGHLDSIRVTPEDELAIAVAKLSSMVSPKELDGDGGAQEGGVLMQSDGVAAADDEKLKASTQLYQALAAVGFPVPETILESAKPGGHVGPRS